MNNPEMLNNLAQKWKSLKIGKFVLWLEQKLVMHGPTVVIPESHVDLLSELENKEIIEFKKGNDSYQIIPSPFFWELVGKIRRSKAMTFDHYEETFGPDVTALCRVENRSSRPRKFHPAYGEIRIRRRSDKEGVFLFQYLKEQKEYIEIEIDEAYSYCDGSSHSSNDNIVTLLISFSDLLRCFLVAGYTAFPCTFTHRRDINGKVPEIKGEFRKNDKNYVQKSIKEKLEYTLKEMNSLEGAMKRMLWETTIKKKSFKGILEQFQKISQTLFYNIPHVIEQYLNELEKEESCTEQSST